ncbi:MAG: amidohydrolase family protein [Chitinophagales bacterium]|nr:amidohydrolase family protein [Chitinophagales bacterium]MCZ2394136.1 amidohydrolase family protein [Chitinophagales bacterium]
MFRKISADYIYPVSSSRIEKGVIVIDSQGKILEIGNRDQYEQSEIQIFDGIIIPGMVNTHCHLELSHMKGKISTGTGLLTFIGNVVKERGADPLWIQKCIEEADQQMYDSGIVAVGDISNKTDTFLTKNKSKIRYYTFIENFDFMQADRTVADFEMYKKVFDLLEESPLLKKSMVPHASYSVSEALFELINSVNQNHKRTISIHNQETPPENELFLSGEGAFNDFYSHFNLNLNTFKPIGKSAIYYVIENLDPQQKTLFVHNTLTLKEEIIAVQSAIQQVYWATCPNANLYIENRLPNYKAFIESGSKLTIGTDSLTSNWQLSILEEMKTILKYQSFLSFEEVLKWATINGAEALGWEDEIGTIQINKTPGLVLIEQLSEDQNLLPTSISRRIA